MIPLTKKVLDNGVLVDKPLYVLRRISDKFVINSRAVSNTTGLPNPGPDQEYLPILTEVPPDHDPLFTVRTQAEAANDGNHTWEITYTVADRPKEEQKASLENAKRLQVQKQVPPQDSTEMIVRTLAAVLRDAKGLALTAEEQSFKDKLITIAAALEVNSAALADKVAAVEAGQKPDPDANWAPVAVAAVVP